MDEKINSFLKCRNIALYGVSKTPNKFGNYIYKELISKDYNIFAIHKEKLENIKTYQSINDVKDQIDAVIICTSPKNTIQILNEIKDLKLEHIWLQRGSENVEVLIEAEKLGLDVIFKKCVLMYMEPVKSFHSIHKAISKLLGKY
jgi:predicted CoA-binding protein